MIEYQLYMIYALTIYGQIGKGMIQILSAATIPLTRVPLTLPSPPPRYRALPRIFVIFVSFQNMPADHY